MPFGNVAPDEGLQTGTRPDGPAGQLSLAAGAGNVTTAVHRFGSVGRLKLAGHVSVGSCVSLTVIVKLHDAEFFDASLTVQVTVVTPFGNVEPDAGLQTGVSGVPPFGLVGLSQLSLTAGGLYVTTAEH